MPDMEIEPVPSALGRVSQEDCELQASHLETAIQIRKKDWDSSVTPGHLHWVDKFKEKGVCVELCLQENIISVTKMNI